MNIEKTEEILGYSFRNKSLLMTAISHPSIRYTKEKSLHFEKLEFLGDRVLGFCIALLMYKNLEKESEVDFAIRLANLASTESLIDIAYKNDLVKCFEIALGKSLTSRQHNSAIADVLEAIFAAIYLDGGLDSVLTVVSKFILPKLTLPNAKKKDCKSKLQEYSQRIACGLPEYTVLEMIGPSHNPIFVIQVKVGNRTSVGKGHSKKEAEQEAAEKLLKNLKGRKQ